MLVELKQLKRGMDLVEPARCPRSTIPILSSLKATVAAGSLTLHSNDLDRAFTATIPVKSDDADDLGDFLISEPRSVIAALGAAGGELVAIEPRADTDDEESATRKHKLAIKSGQFSMNQATGMTPPDFPANMSRVGAKGFEAQWSADTLKQIARVFPAISTEETRYYLNGVRMTKKPGTEWDYRFVATDGHRLFIIDIPLPDAAGSMLDEETQVGDVILPRAFITSVAKLLEKSKEPIAFTLGDGSPPNEVDKTLADKGGSASRCSISGKVGDIAVQFDGKLIDGTYPDVNRVIPQKEAVRRVMTVDLRAFRQAVHAVKAAAVTRKRDTPALKFEWTEGKVTVSRALGDVHGTARFDVACEHNCSGTTAGFNGKYFLEILNALQGDEVVVMMPDEDTTAGPVLIRDPADTAFLAVLMPMRV